MLDLTSPSPTAGTTARALSSSDVESKGSTEEEEARLLSSRESRQRSLFRLRHKHIHGLPRLSPRRLIYLCGFAASLCSVLLGYDVGVMSVARRYVDDDLNLSLKQSEIIMGSLNIVAAFGGLIAGKTADHCGRKAAIAIACLIFLIGSLCMTLSMNFAALLVGRIITGIGVGNAFVVAPVYIAEITPPDIRGRLVSLTDICINVGIVFGSIVGFLCEEAITAPTWKWRVMLGIGALPPIVILISLRFLPESPRWLLLKDRVSEARTVLNVCLGNEEAADREVLSIVDALRLENDVTSNWSEVLWPRHRAIAVPVLLGLGLGLLQQVSGSEAAVYYAPQIFQERGITSDVQQSLANVGVSSFKFAGELLAMNLMDSVGRKPLLLSSTLLSSAFLMLSGLCFTFSLPPGILVTSICLFMGSFSVGLGAITFVVASEIFPLAVRGKAMSLTVFTNRMMSGVVALSFLSLVQAISYSGTFYLFAALSLLSSAFYVCLLPETKGKTLEEITRTFESKLSLSTQEGPGRALPGTTALSSVGSCSFRRFVDES